MTMNWGKRLKTEDAEDFYEALFNACDLMLEEQWTYREAVRTVVDHFASSTHSLDKLDRTGKSPLHYAVQHANCVVAEAFLLYGANVNCQQKGRLITPLHVAASTDELDMIKLLIEYGADVNKPCADGTTAIYQTAIFGSHKSLKYLIEHKADIKNRDIAAGYTLLHLSALGVEPGKDDVSTDRTQQHQGQNFRHNKLNTLVNMGLDVNDRGYCGVTPLQLAVVMSNVDGVADLIELGAEIDFRNNEDFTALHMGALLSNFPIVENLIKVGANVNITAGVDGWTPLHLSVMTEISWSLGDCRTNIEFSSHLSDNWPEIDIRSKLLNIEVVKRLIKSGALLDAKDNTGQTPLHHAARLKNHRFAEILLDAGAQINIEDNLHRTPLMIALLCDNTPMVRMMLTFGADINDTDIVRQVMINHNATWKVIIEHAIKLKLIDLTITADYEACIWQHEFTEFYDLCSLEANALKSYQLGNLSLFRFITMNEKLQKNFVNEVSGAYDKLRQAFPLYFGIIRSKCNEALIRHRHLEIAREIWPLRMPFFPLNDVCTEQVLFHLNNRYLEVFLRSPKIEIQKIASKNTKRGVIDCAVGKEEEESNTE